jgi:methylmalonyl-CoA mutase N-terminal domain/subunit
MERDANKIFDQIDAIGGVIAAIEAGYFQKEIADAAYRYQKEVEKREKIIVGVNDFTEEDEKIEIPLLTISPEVEIAQKKRLAALRQSRDNSAVAESLAELKSASMNDNNLMPVLVKAAHNKVTLGEMVGELKEVFGTYEEIAVF